jgi:integrative and conjugative element protein (TIGR02256 family)
MRVLRSRFHRLMRVQSIYLLPQVVSSLVEECQQKMPNETGGILVGRCERGQICVAQIVGPGPKAFHAPTVFRRDGKFAQIELDRLYEESSGQIDYLGEWHSHLWPVGPSPRDRRSMRWVANNPRFDLSNPILIIMQRSRRGVWKPAAFQWIGNELRRSQVEIMPPASHS